MASEPILWVRGPQYKPPQIVRPGPDGEPVAEKLPATAQPPEDHPLAGQAVRRWELMVDEAGNRVRAAYSCAAADYQMDHPQYGAAIKLRHRNRGWFRLGHCPIVLVRSGAIDPSYLHAAIRGESPCERGTYSDRRPCPHALAEERFRQERTSRREAKRADAFRSETERLARQTQENQAAQNANIADLVRTQTELIRSLLGGGGRWPMARPHLTGEEYEAALKQRAAENAAAAAEPTPDEELERLLADADADADAEHEPVAVDPVPGAELSAEIDPPRGAPSGRGDRGRGRRQ